MSHQQLVSPNVGTHYPELLPDLGIMCQSLYVIFHQTPTMAQLEMLDSFTLFNNYFTARQNSVAISSIVRLSSICQYPDENTLKALESDYQQLFIGPQDLSAAPWGSVYLHPNKEMFDDSTVEVDNFYRRHGLLLDTGMNEPADHIGLMFAFLAWLFSRDLDARYHHPSSKTWQNVMGEFVGHYLLPWSGHFLALMEKNASTAFYQQIAVLAQAVISDITNYCSATRKPAIIYP
jgi:TorA maturation chaperone TorD